MNIILKYASKFHSIYLYISICYIGLSCFTGAEIAKCESLDLV